MFAPRLCSAGLHQRLATLTGPCQLCPGGFFCVTVSHRGLGHPLVLELPLLEGFARLQHQLSHFVVFFFF